jgi:hypothetical protein
LRLAITLFFAGFALPAPFVLHLLTFASLSVEGRKTKKAPKDHDGPPEPFAIGPGQRSWFQPVFWLSDRPRRHAFPPELLGSGWLFAW